MHRQQEEPADVLQPGATHITHCDALLTSLCEMGESCDRTPPAHSSAHRSGWTTGAAAAGRRRGSGCRTPGPLPAPAA